MEPELDPLASAPRRVEAYLDQILAPLARRLSPFHREELRRELREHLWSRVDAYRELGMAEDEAVTEALRQFGGGKDFLRQWRREWAQTTPQATLREVWEATRLALPISVSALLLAWLPLLLVFYQFNADRNGPSSWLYSHYDTFNDVWVCLCFMLPVALGLIVGQRTGRYAALGTFAALTADCLFGCLISAIGAYLWEQAIGFREIADRIAWLAALWIPVACTSAALSSRWLHRSKSRRLA